MMGHSSTVQFRTNAPSKISTLYFINDEIIVSVVRGASDVSVVRLKS